MASFDSLALAPNGVRYLYEYHPWHGGSNPHFRHDPDGVILDLKKCNPKAIDRFVLDLAGCFVLDSLGMDSASIAVAPSSRAGNLTTGIRAVAKQLAATNGCEDLTPMLVRSTAVPEKSRSLSDHLRSITVDDPDARVKGKRVVVMDDVCTSGATLLACREILLKAGATHVDMVAIGFTVVTPRAPDRAGL